MKNTGDEDLVSFRITTEGGGFWLRTRTTKLSEACSLLNCEIELQN